MYCIFHIYFYTLQMFFSVRDHRLRRKSVDTVDAMSVDQNEEPVDKKIEKEIEELSKMTHSGAAKVILGDLKKMKTDGPILDPRSASRTPNASVEPPVSHQIRLAKFRL